MSDMSWLTARPIAHRGFHDMNGKRWENTLPAFEAAASRGYAIECDVHLAADGVPIVFHDRELDRLTGHEGHIWERSAAALSGMSVGGTADRVPRLSEVLELVAGRVPMVVELKGTPGKDDGLVAAVARDLSAYRGEAAIMSFAHHLVRRFEADAPGIPFGLTAEGVQPRNLEHHFSMLAYRISFVSFNVKELPNPFVTFVRERLGLPVISWTVDSPVKVEATHAHADQMTFEGFEP